jgi:hypothetical protein
MYLDYENELWSYRPSLNQWSFVGREIVRRHKTSYGFRGVSTPTNNPSPRSKTSLVWISKLNALFFLGGENSDFYIDSKPDTWLYNVQTKEFVWTKGGNWYQEAAVFGTQGVSDPNNKPSVIEGHSSVLIPSMDAIAIFGGVANPIGGLAAGEVADTWLYNYITNEYTWLDGTGSTLTMANYGVRGTPGPTVKPGARKYHGTIYNNNNGLMYVFGGEGNTRNGRGSINDNVWMNEDFN